MMTASGPILPTWALQQVVSWYTGHQINVVVTAAHDPYRSFPASHQNIVEGRIRMFEVSKHRSRFEGMQALVALQATSQPLLPLC
jgi:hypothetical protein